MDMEGLSNKLDAMSEKISLIRETQARLGAVLDINIKDIKADLKEHMRRTGAAEERLDILEKDKAKWNGAVWATGAIAAFASGVATLAVQLIFR